MTDLRKRFWKFDILPNLYTSCFCVTDILNPHQFCTAFNLFIRVWYYQFSNLKTFVFRLTYYKNKVILDDSVSRNVGFSFRVIPRKMDKWGMFRVMGCYGRTFFQTSEICTKTDFLMNSVLGLEPLIQSILLKFFNFSRALNAKLIRWMWTFITAHYLYTLLLSFISIIGFRIPLLSR